MCLEADDGLMCDEGDEKAGLGSSGAACSLTSFGSWGRSGPCVLGFTQASSSDREPSFLLTLHFLLWKKHLRSSSPLAYLHLHTCTVSWLTGVFNNCVQNGYSADENARSSTEARVQGAQVVLGPDPQPPSLSSSSPSAAPAQLPARGSAP